MLKNHIIFAMFILWVLPNRIAAQEITIFKVSDFDLKGNVKSCLVSTDYGKEEYRFDKSNRLVEAVTRYNESDYDLTLYKYKDYELIEKRLENYRGKALDKVSSIGHFYDYDSIKNRKVTEKIITYTKEFLEQYEYNYTADNKLSKIVRTNNDGIDETSVVYYDDEEGAGANYILNRELHKSTKTKIEAVSDSTSTKTVTTKRFFEGNPNTATESIYNDDGMLMSRTQFLYDTKAEEFVLHKKRLITYDQKGIILKQDINADKKLITKEFIHQFDQSGNWIKQIITPENSYKTRVIDYYDVVEAPIQEE